MSEEIKKPETEVERHGVCDHKIEELREEVEEKDGIISLLREEVEEEYEKVARILKKNKSLKTEVVRLNDIVEEQNRTISSDKTLIKSLKTTLEALRADAKASQDLHAKNLDEGRIRRLHEVAHYQICLESRNAELAEAKEQIKSLRQDRPDSEMTDSYNEQTDKEITDIILDPGRRLEKLEEYIKLILGYLLTLRGEKFSPSPLDRGTPTNVVLAEAMDELLGGTE